MHYDVAIIGGGPGGSTTAGFLRKHDPDIKVLVLEREKFPRDHVGESLLPPICNVLDELGCWDKMEAANFPIKLGATYRWGKNPELWDFEFVPRSEFKDEPRPAKYEGQRRWTAFQVDRSIYDDILLRHAEELGAEVREETRVVKIRCEGDRITGLELDGGEVVTADTYIDASGHSGILRRTLGVESEVPTALQNIAIWEYWQNAEWADTTGVGGTFIQIYSVGYGWFWFIPISPTRTSIGFVTSAKYFKESGIRPQEFYDKAISEEARITGLIANATREGELHTTKDWSFVSSRMSGENWMLVGESGGFADPILSAGLSLTHTAAREAAFTILEKRCGTDWAWLREQFDRGQTRRVGNHIRFADYWYTANGQFKDLQEFTAEIAASNGLDLAPDKAWAWIAQGGFIDEEMTLGLAGFSVDQVKVLSRILTDSEPVDYVKGNNIFRLNLMGAKKVDRAVYAAGKVERRPCYIRGNKTLPSVAVIDLVIHVLNHWSTRPDMDKGLRHIADDHKDNDLFVGAVLAQFENALESMVSDGWVSAYYEPSIAMTPLPGSLTVLKWLSGELTEAAPATP